MNSPILVWFLIWLSVWITFNTIIRWPTEIFKSKKYIFRALFFIGVNLSIFLGLNGSLDSYKIGLFVGLVICLLVGHSLSTNKSFYKKFPKDKTFLMLSSFNLLFQQIMVVWGVNILQNQTFQKYQDFYFGIMFFTAHLPILLAKWSVYRYQMLLLSFLGGTLFSYLIRNFVYGVTVNFLIHFAIYVFLLYKTKDEEKI